MQQESLLKRTYKEVSCYISFDDELKNILKVKQYTIPIFIPHFGCNNECVFCNQRRISGTKVPPTICEVRCEIEKRLSEFSDSSRKIQIAFFGGSFTGLDISDQIKYLEVAYSFVLLNKVDSIRISTRPDYINVKILKILKKYGVKNIELGVQSMDEEVLLNAKRGHSSLDVIRASKLISLFGFELGFQIMVGLPKSTCEKEVATVKRLLCLKPKEFRIYPVYVILQTELYDMYVNGSYVPLEFEDAVNRTYMLVKEINNENVKIIRIGLQSTEEISQTNGKVIGPVCDNFSEYVLSKIFLDKIDNVFNNLIEIRNINTNKTKTIFTVFVDKYVPISLVVGPKKINSGYIFNKYHGIMKVKIKNGEE